LPLIASGNRRPYFIENQFSGLGAYKKKKKLENKKTLKSWRIAQWYTSQKMGT
jgi:hypothetical protein